MTVRTIRLGSLALVVGVVSSCAAAASVSQAPHWIDILPLSDPFLEVHVADAVIGDENVCHVSGNYQNERQNDDEKNFQEFFHLILVSFLNRSVHAGDESRNGDI